MQRSLAFAIGLADIQTLIDAKLERFQSLGLRSAGVLVAIADAGGEEQRVVAIFGDQLGIGSGLRARRAWWRRRRTGPRA